MNDVIKTIFLISKESIVIIELMHQCLHRIHRVEIIFAQFRFQVIYVSRFDQEIDDFHIFEIDKIEIRIFRIEIKIDKNENKICKIEIKIDKIET